MKLSLFSLILLMSTSSFATTIAASDGITLGIPNGLYAGTGTLIAQTPMVPNLKFQSMRRLQNGIIQARTKAHLMGLQIAEASATLQIRMKDAHNFEMLNLEDNGTVCGRGFCDDGFCTFSAKVMQGELELHETWIATQNGFQVIKASQNFKGIKSTYRGAFVLR